MHINKSNLPKKILTWYDNNKRILPWRVSQKSQSKQYYRILSEFMAPTNTSKNSNTLF